MYRLHTHFKMKQAERTNEQKEGALKNPCKRPDEHRSHSANILTITTALRTYGGPDVS